MNIAVFAVFDSKAGSFALPFYSQNRGSAQRMLSSQLAQDTKGLHSQYPQDFQLYELGVYDDESGLFECGTPAFVINFADLVEAK